MTKLLTSPCEKFTAVYLKFSGNFTVYKMEKQTEEQVDYIKIGEFIKRDIGGYTQLLFEPVHCKPLTCIELLDLASFMTIVKIENQSI